MAHPTSHGAAAAPDHPRMTATVDQARGAIRARGHVDRLGADLLCGTVQTLRRSGHRRITLELGPFATADAEARRLLDCLAGELRTRGASLTVC
jgi:hypothetical protein